MILALLVIHVESLQEASLSVFGLFNGPRRAYPLVLLLLWQLLVPASSFIGHLAGTRRLLNSLVHVFASQHSWLVG